MRAVILAAGRGTRMGPINSKIPKCLNVFQDITLLERLITQMMFWTTEITIIVGYKSDQITALINEKFPGNKITIIHNPLFNEDTNIYSVKLGLAGQNEDIIIFEADCIFSDSCFEVFFDEKMPLSSWFTIGKFRSDQVGAVLKKNKAGLVEDIKILSNYDAQFSNYDKLIGVLRIKKAELKLYKELLDRSLAVTLKQYYLQPWIDNLSALPSTAISLAPRFAEAFNTIEDYRKIRNNNEK